MYLIMPLPNSRLEGGGSFADSHMLTVYWHYALKFQARSLLKPTRK